MSLMDIPWLNTEQPYFPDVYKALKQPNGLLAVGGQLTPDWLKAAYHKGIFPWFSDNEPIIWWSPSPRMVLYPERLRINRSLRKHLKKNAITHVSFDRRFADVINHCAQVRANTTGTWLVPSMISAYCEAHRQGFAHSVEVWQHDTLVGGLYGVNLGSIFFGESMFSLTTNASKYALLALTAAQTELSLIDCQMKTAYLKSMGGEEIDRADFQQHLKASYEPNVFISDTVLSHSDLLSLAP
ncbi:leucyl/phenylalanyl-tRNA--protein transferase [Gynuella sp.]|uniref:leucyl/phenylalanyl-tRNA--protein transferase n=1 Tax=Gynuella sp. TaxID=2969146 RepID=UPI003D11DCB4